MSAVTEILTNDELHDLWGAGFTIVRRGVDPFEIDPKLIPKGRSYQWNPIKPDVGVKVTADEGWTPVPYSRHEGVFAPWGTPGDVTHGGLQLVERATQEVQLKREAARAEVAKVTSDWAAKNAALGITGSARVVAQDSFGSFEVVSEVPVGATVIEANKTIETTVGIPRDMTPHIATIFKERDRLVGDVVMKDRTLRPGPIADKFYAAVDGNPGAPWWPTLRAILLPIAVDNVRDSLKSPAAQRLQEAYAAARQKFDNDGDTISPSDDGKDKTDE